MTSRFSLLLAATAIISAGCSAPADGGGGAPPAPPGAPPPLDGTGNAQAGTGAELPVGQGGSAGAPVAAGGTGGIPVATGGTGGAQAAGGAPAGNGEIPVGTGLAITPDAEGWVAGETNGLGVQGAFFAASDATSDTGTPTNTGTVINFDTTTPGSVCVDGTLAAIAPATPGGEDFQYDIYWGASVGLNLRQVIPAGAMAMPPSPWPRTTPAGTVAGFGYAVTANGTPLPEMRFTVEYVGQAAGSTYCAPIPAGSSGTTLGTVVSSCWPGGTPNTPLPGADLMNIQWSLIPATAGPTPFDFCITNVQAMVQ